MIPNVIEAVGVFPKSLEKDLEDSEIREIFETLQTTVLLKSAKILREILQSPRVNLLLRLFKDHQLRLV